MADQLYLSLWFPNFRFEALPAALTSVLRQFAHVSQSQEGKRVAAASAYPLSFSESPTWQRVYVNDERSEDTSDSIIENAVAEATEYLHEDMAYEFEMRWKLWVPASGPRSRSEDEPEDEPESREELESALHWKPESTTVRILGFGPQFDDAAFEQNGHIRIDFGLDTPFVADDTALDDSELDPLTAKHIQQNIEMLLAVTLSIEKNCGISSRLLWTESGEPLAEKLIARFQRLN